MLDKKTLITLKVLNLICEDDVYKVVDYDGLMSHFPKKVKCDKSKLEDVLNYLKAGQYIDIKYSQDDTYCLCVMPKGKMFLEDTDSDIKTMSRFTKLLFACSITSGIMAFLGAFLAIMILKGM